MSVSVSWRRQHCLSTKYLCFLHVFRNQIGKLFLPICFILLELSECEIAQVSTASATSASAPSYLVGSGCVLVPNDGTFTSCDSISRTTIFEHPGVPTLLPSTTGFPPPQVRPVQLFSPNMRFTVQSGDMVLFPCSVNNLADNQLLWRHDKDIVTGIAGDRDIPLRDPRRHIMLEDYTLKLTNIVPEDQGNYECLITTTWPPLSVVHTLTVIDPPTISIDPDSGSVIVNEFDTVTIGCIPKGNPLPQISWTKRDGAIPLDPKLLRKTHITLENVSRQDAGIYICHADNHIGRPATGSIYVRVLHIPKITAPIRIYAGVKFQAILSCTVGSDPPAEVQWLFRRKPVFYSGRIYRQAIGKEYRLVISAVGENDFGMYTCIAKNSLGRDESHIELTGVPKPPVVTKWKLSSCIPNSSSDQRFASSTRIQKSPSTSKGQVVQSDSELGSSQLQRSLVSTTLISPDCSIQMTLFWEVETYGTLIDYRLIFQVVTTSDNTSPSSKSEKTGTSKDIVVVPNNEDVGSWRDMTIPADPSVSFVHSKSVTLSGLKNGTAFECGIKARNKFGYSFLSDIIHIEINTELGHAKPSRNNKTRHQWQRPRDRTKEINGKAQRRISSPIFVLVIIFVIAFQSIVLIPFQQYT